jgi:hypothetical protein
MPINLKLEEATKYYEMTKGEGLLFDGETEVKNWIHPAKHIAITDEHEDNSHYIHAYTDGSRNEAGVGAGIAIYAGNSLKTTLKFRLNDRCTNNQAEQMTILKALEYIQHVKEGGGGRACTHRQQNNSTIARKPKMPYISNRSNQE